MDTANPRVNAILRSTEGASSSAGRQHTPVPRAAAPAPPHRPKAPAHAPHAPRGGGGGRGHSDAPATPQARLSCAAVPFPRTPERTPATSSATPRSSPPPPPRSSDCALRFAALCLAFAVADLHTSPLQRQGPRC